MARQIVDYESFHIRQWECRRIEFGGDYCDKCEEEHPALFSTFVAHDQDPRLWLCLTVLETPTENISIFHDDFDDEFWHRVCVSIGAEWRHVEADTLALSARQQSAQRTLSAYSDVICQIPLQEARDQRSRALRNLEKSHLERIVHSYATSTN